MMGEKRKKRRSNKKRKKRRPNSNRSAYSAARARVDRARSAKTG